MRVSVSPKPVRSPKRLTVHYGLDSMKAYQSRRPSGLSAPGPEPGKEAPMGRSNHILKSTLDSDADPAAAVLNGSHPYTAIVEAAGYDLHGLARLFPPMKPDEYEGLKVSLARDGQQQPIMRFGELVLDGVHRLAACIELELEPKFETFSGAGRELRAYVLAQNLHRRHLSVAQRALIAAEMATGQHGGDRGGQAQAEAPPTQREAAAALNVSERSVRQARKIQARADPEVVDAMRAGDISLNAAVKTINEAEPRSARAIAKDEDGNPLTADQPELDPSAGNCAQCGQRTDAALLDKGVCPECRTAAEALDTTPQHGALQDLSGAQTEAPQRRRQNGPYTVLQSSEIPWSEFFKRVGADVLEASRRLSRALTSIPPAQMDAAIDEWWAELPADERSANRKAKEAWINFARELRAYNNGTGKRQA